MYRSDKAAKKYLNGTKGFCPYFMLKIDKKGIFLTFMEPCYRDVFLL